jgi:hypothetical protein
MDPNEQEQSLSLYPPPSRDEYFDFLVRCLFGKGDLLHLCVHRAYRDFNRTLHGFASHEHADRLRACGYQCVIELLRDLPKRKISSQREFDRWHETACAKLQNLYNRDHGFDRLYVGQAQKWLNMSVKYVFTLGEGRLPGFESLYQFAHIPIDNVFLEAVSPHGPNLGVAWSRLDDYATYLNCQQAYRELFRGSIPLAAEFRLWLAS